MILSSFLVLLCAVHLLLCAEGGQRPQISRPRPMGDFVCANIETVFNCSYDDPEAVLNVLWNIPGHININLSHYTTGHVVNYTMMDKGYVTVHVANVSHLLNFYECSVLYNNERIIESSMNSAVPKQVPSDGMEIMNMSVSYTNWLERNFIWEPSFTESECIEMWLSWQSGAHRGSARASHTSLTMSQLPLAFTIDGSVEAMANGECISRNKFEFGTTRECFSIIIPLSILGLILLVVFGSVPVVVILYRKRPRNETKDASMETEKGYENVEKTNKDERAIEQIKNEESHEESNSPQASPTSEDGLLGALAT